MSVDHTFGDMINRHALQGHYSKGITQITADMFSNAKLGSPPPEIYQLDSNNANQVLGFLMEGRDLTPILNKALSEDASPHDVMMAQAVLDVKITGQWDHDTITAAQTHLQKPKLL